VLAYLGQHSSNRQNYAIVCPNLTFYL